MSRKTKIWLTVAASLTIIGLIIFGGTMAMIKWDFSRLSTVQYETERYEIYEMFENISVITDTADIEFVISENGKATVVCREEPKAKHSVAVKNGTLTIELWETRKWYEHIHIGITVDSPKITVYLPSGEYGALSVKGRTGRTSIAKEFTFESIDIALTTGEINNYASAIGAVKLKATTGAILVQNVKSASLSMTASTGSVSAKGVTCTGDVTVKVSTGRLNAENVSSKSFTSTGSTGSASLKNVIAEESFSVKRSTGSIKLDGCDAASIVISTDTGNITGTLLSEKNFIASSDTGNISVPDTHTGGRCELTTDTGDIKISIKKCAEAHYRALSYRA